MTYKEALENAAKSWTTSQKLSTSIVSSVGNQIATAGAASKNTGTTAVSRSVPRETCPQLPGTLLRISIPEGTTINLLNLVEVASPGGVCLIVRLPLPTGLTGGRSPSSILQGLMNAIKAAGGSIEILS